MLVTIWRPENMVNILQAWISNTILKIKRLNFE